MTKSTVSQKRLSQCAFKEVCFREPSRQSSVFARRKGVEKCSKWPEGLEIWRSSPERREIRVKILEKATSRRTTGLEVAEEAKERGNFRLKQRLSPPLNATREHIMNVLMGENRLQTPLPMRETPYVRNPNQRCAYHQDVGHSTEDCYQLKKAIQKLVDHGELGRFERVNGHQRKRPREAWEIDQARGDRPVINTKMEEIVFRRSELAPNPIAWLQPLTLTVGIHNWVVKRVLVGTGAWIDILYYKCFLAMGLGDTDLTPSKVQLEDFSGHKGATKGIVTLKVIMGEGITTRTEDITFFVLDLSSPYNAVLGTPAQSKFQMVASITHQRVKFLTDKRVGIVKNDRRSVLDYMFQEKKTEEVGHSALVAIFDPGGELAVT